MEIVVVAAGVHFAKTRLQINGVEADAVQLRFQDPLGNAVVAQLPVDAWYQGVLPYLNDPEATRERVEQEQKLQAIRQDITKGVAGINLPKDPRAG